MFYTKPIDEQRKQPRLRIRSAFFWMIVFFVMLSAVPRVFLFGHAQSFKQLISKVHFPSNETSSSGISVDWPNDGQAALMIGGRFYGQHGSGTPVPTASLAKMMTAILVLQKYPLSQAGNGPTYTVTPEDVEIYNEEYSQDESVVKVVAGETLTERQMLEALLLPSGDNIAVMLADWVSGSVSAFVNQMNAEAQQFGLAHTYYADPAGISQQTESTAVDQLKVASTAMSYPVFKEIVGQKNATFPEVGTIQNTNLDLGEDGVVGLKTGNLAHIGNMAIAAYRNVDHKRVLVIGVVLGQYGQNDGASLHAALEAGKSLITSAGGE